MRDTQPRDAQPGDRVALVTLGIGAALALVPLRHVGLIPNDEGWLIHPAMRMTGGDVLYRDVWVHYAPLRYHVLATLFEWLGTSLAVERGLLLALLLASVLGLYRLSRRFAPPILAWLPGAAYALAPGPWHKAPYTFCSVFFFLALARFLERSSPGRTLALGAMTGLTLATRQDLGLAQLGLMGLVLVARPWLTSETPASERLATALRHAALGLAGAGLMPGWLALLYAREGALASLLEAVFVRSFAQTGGTVTHNTWRLFSPSSFGSALEGPLAGAWLLAIAAVYAGAIALWLWRWRRGGFDPLGTALLLYALATMPQAYVPPMLVRFLQSGTPLYVLGVAALAEFARRVGGVAALVAGVAVFAGFVGSIVFGVDRILPGDAYSGSWRMRGFESSVRVLHTEIRTSAETAGEIRRVRQFLDARSDPGDPIFTAPSLSLWYAITDRRNPTRYVFERRARGDFVFSATMKQGEVERLLDSGARFALVARPWWTLPTGSDAIKRALQEHFAPALETASLVVLERRDVGHSPMGTDPRAQ